MGLLTWATNAQPHEEHVEHLVKVDNFYALRFLCSFAHGNAFALDNSAKDLTNMRWHTLLLLLTSLAWSAEVLLFISGIFINVLIVIMHKTGSNLEKELNTFLA